jgi:predicted RNA-binding Zn-ribbon protein involved in translation (DUF1610 family)
MKHAITAKVQRQDDLVYIQLPQEFVTLLDKIVHITIKPAYKEQECPACGHEESSLFHLDDRLGSQYAVECCNCGMRGPRATNEAEAVREWNKIGR